MGEEHAIQIGCLQRWNVEVSSGGGRPAHNTRAAIEKISPALIDDRNGGTGSLRIGDRRARPKHYYLSARKRAGTNQPYQKQQFRRAAILALQHLFLTELFELLLSDIVVTFSQLGGRLMSHCSRRDFLKTGLAAGALAATGSIPSIAKGATATDWVTLGKSDVKVTRLAFGTGTLSGRVQRDLGQDQFTRLVRYAYDRGIRFFETAESYGEMHKMLGIALKGIPRDSYRLMSKVTTSPGVDPQEKIDELRKLANTEYFDIMLLHWQHVATWPTDSIRWQDGHSGSPGKKIVLGHGASVHGLPALAPGARNKWLQVAMIRMNHKGVAMDAEDYDTVRPGRCERGRLARKTSPVTKAWA